MEQSMWIRRKIWIKIHEINPGANCLSRKYTEIRMFKIENDLNLLAFAKSNRTILELCHGAALF
jgi:hypothetical protein